MKCPIPLWGQIAPLSGLPGQDTFKAPPALAPFDGPLCLCLESGPSALLWVVVPLAGSSDLSFSASSSQYAPLRSVPQTPEDVTSSLVVSLKLPPPVLLFFLRIALIF